MSEPVDVVYLGPRGTFTEQAVLGLVDPARVTLAPVGSVAAALEAVRTGGARSAVVPFENSVEGSVSATLDALIHGPALVITAEQHVQVRFALLARPGTEPGDVARVATHPHAEAQTRRWVRAHLPGAEVVPETSTARAAELVAAGVHDAAIAAPLAATVHGLTVLADDIADREGAVTRFVRLGLPGAPPPPTGADMTTVVAFIRHNHPGALLEVLDQFAARGVDLTRLESRPTGEGLGRYCFAIDADAHVSEPRMAEALAGLHRTCREVRYLGSYPRADGARTQVSGLADARAYDQARAWVEALQAGTGAPAGPGTR